MQVNEIVGRDNKCKEQTVNRKRKYPSYGDCVVNCIPISCLLDSLAVNEARTSLLWYWLAPVFALHETNVAVLVMEDHVVVRHHRPAKDIEGRSDTFEDRGTKIVQPSRVVDELVLSHIEVLVVHSEHKVTSFEVARQVEDAVHRFSILGESVLSIVPLFDRLFPFESPDGCVELFHDPVEVNFRDLNVVPLRVKDRVQTFLFVTPGSHLPTVLGCFEYADVVTKANTLHPAGPKVVSVDHNLSSFIGHIRTCELKEGVILVS